MFLVVLEGMVYTVGAIFAAAALYLGTYVRTKIQKNNFVFDSLSQTICFWIFLCASSLFLFIYLFWLFFQFFLGMRWYKGQSVPFMNVFNPDSQVRIITRVGIWSLNSFFLLSSFHLQIFSSYFSFFTFHFSLPIFFIFHFSFFRCISRISNSCLRRECR